MNSRFQPVETRRKLSYINFIIEYPMINSIIDNQKCDLIRPESSKTFLFLFLFIIQNKTKQSEVYQLIAAVSNLSLKQERVMRIASSVRIVRLPCCGQVLR